MAVESNRPLPIAAGAIIWPISLTLQAGLCVGGVGVLQHSAMPMLCGGFVAFAVALLLVVQILATRHNQQGMVVLAGGMATSLAALAALAVVAAAGWILLRLLFTLASNGSAWLDAGPQPLLLLPTLALLIIGSCCSISVVIGAAGMTALLWSRDKGQRKERGTT